MIDTTFNMFIETEVPENELIISRTNLDGVITYVNETFAKISGYESSELIGKAHNIVRHPDMPKSVFKELWNTIKSGKSWSGYVKNLRKDGGYYWVYAEISGVYKDGEIVELKSIREPVDNNKKIQMQNFYDELRAKEENSCRVVVYTSCDNLDKIEALEK